jgi:lauroyl/myristoyl acyltransferase
MRSELRLLKDLAGWMVYHPGSALVSATPRQWWMPLAQLGGDVSRWMADGGEEMREELERTFGARPLPHDADEIIRDAYRAAMFNELEVLRYASLTAESIDEVCSIEGREHLDTALARGKGAIVLIGHFGANQMIMPALGHHGYPMNQLSAPPPVWAEILRDTRTNGVWEKTLHRRWQLEKQLPVRHINVFRFLRPAFDCLQRNEVLGLAFDGGGGRGWTQVPIMDRMANLSTQPIQLWRKSGAALLPAFVVRTPGETRHRIVIEPPLDWQAGADRTAEDAQNMAAFVARFEPWLEAHPDHYLQYMLMRRRVRATDVRPLFTDYPPAPDQLSPADAEARLRRAGEWEDTP